MSERLSAEELEQIRCMYSHYDATHSVNALLKELDAATRERDWYQRQYSEVCDTLRTAIANSTLADANGPIERIAARAIRERDEARKDSARLDWLQNDQGRAVYPGAVWGKPWACGERAYSELRNAIDDGMSWEVAK